MNRRDIVVWFNKHADKNNSDHHIIKELLEYTFELQEQLKIESWKDEFEIVWDIPSIGDEE